MIKVGRWLDWISLDRAGLVAPGRFRGVNLVSTPRTSIDKSCSFASKLGYRDAFNISLQLPLANLLVHATTRYGTGTVTYSFTSPFVRDGAASPMCSVLFWNCRLSSIRQLNLV
jgi:hypothetical protein